MKKHPFSDVSRPWFADSWEQVEAPAVHTLYVIPLQDAR
ncbi:hypothetical protein ALP68_102673 [Pseudomonas ficuserectae]|uniref:Uncharacterized protein n=12 Tax=Pseudomonas syringae group TaxID=136849 RepID=A0AAX1W4Y6_PSEAJ|nr:Unknown protein sequence [Pseudomonas syringae pv. maculicola]KPC03750.1 Unknown protein sequence [Pseudomonas amygdali pv. lachrymans]KPC41450.1 Unknown protein sequence [Pseudomonas savastanoi pv. glycinea]KPW27703.1 hypothetical protein ALO51_102672 [Pseudomonas amygdali]KPW69644.1 hypothetical protein ALO78_102480 [Pseudomonas amygdali pv. ciccaronei]KPW94067.1 hypothetical protein ALO79_100822 [Pseudomonas syringae pv. castaneae]KPX20138.1 hypothetical protein ALO71_102714 [Pseudomona